MAVCGGTASLDCRMKVTSPRRQRFNGYPIGFLHIDIAGVQTAEGKALLVYCWRDWR